MEAARDLLLSGLSACLLSGRGLRPLPPPPDPGLRPHSDAVGRAPVGGRRFALGRAAAKLPLPGGGTASLGEASASPTRAKGWLSGAGLIH